MYSYKKISMYSYKKVSLLRRLYWLVEPSHRFFEWKQEICLLKSVIENEKNTEIMWKQQMLFWHVYFCY